jgi:hypothetical protein
MCHGNGNHALAEVVHNEVDQTLHWMISLHLYEDVSLGQLPRVRTLQTIALAPAHTQHCANGGCHINIQLKILWVQTGHLVALIQQLLMVYIIYKQGITQGVVASCSTMTVANIFHFCGVTKFILLKQSSRTLGPDEPLKSQ